MILWMMSLLLERRPLSCSLSARTITRSMSVPPVRCVRPLLALMSVPPRTVALIAKAKFIARCGAVRIGGSIFNRIAVKSLPTSSPPPGGQACRVLAYKLLKRSDDSDGDDDNPYDDSQESLIVSIVECKTFISDYESQHRDQKKLLKSSLRDLSNEK